jgi:hypothetical protein
MKQNALAAEDYTTANQIKEKMAVIQSQLDRMDDQFTADILQNCVTNWQNEMANVLQDSLSSLNKVRNEFHLIL